MPSAYDSYFPKADATVLQSKFTPPSPTSRPTAVAPILDVDNADRALNAWSVEVAESVYPSKENVWAPAPIPSRAGCPQLCTTDRYLFPVLTRNERLRLTMLFYYTRGALEDQELMSRLQEKVTLAKETVGWEFVIAGLLNHNTYTRMVTDGLPLAVLPRRESTCAHTVNQPPGTVFSLLNMNEDWRFKESPHVAEGGLRAYAGVPLRFETEFGQHIAFGSLCVASNSPQPELSIAQQRSLARLADWIVSDIIHSARARRQRERRRMFELTSKLQKLCEDGANMEEVVVDTLQEIYPCSTAGIYRTLDDHILLEGGTDFKTSDLEHGLWEDCDYFDHMITDFNHREMIAPRIVRVIATQCASQRTPTFLLVSSKDFELVFDDIDSSFIQTCGTILCRYWQGRTLQEALTAKDTFLRGITHQLRTPIHGILGSVELLTEELKARNVVPASASSSPIATPEVEQLDPHLYIKTIRTSARELISTINSLIKLNQWTDIAQAARTYSCYKIGEIESTLLKELTTSLPEDVAARPSLIVRHHLPPHCDLITIDMRLFLDSVQPLIINAVQNTTGGVVAVTITVSEDLQTLIVDVEDNGRGIPLASHHRIFDAYEKVDPHTIEAGLGLTLASKSASLMNGTIALIFSEVAVGSHFRATFSEPICASSFPAHRSVKERFVQLPPTFYRLPSSTMTLSLAHQFGRHLESNGFTLSEAPEGSLIILEHMSSLNQIYRDIAQIPTSQVAICMVPEFAPFPIQFDEVPIQRQENIVFVQGPFISDIFEGVLAEVDAILAEYASLTLNSGICPFGGVAVENDNPIPTAEKHPDVRLDEGIMSELTITTELAQSIQRLRINTMVTSPIPQSPSSSSKPMVLLVDDNTVNLRLLEMYCTRRKVPYRTAKDGAEAVRLFTQQRKPVEDPLLRQNLVPQSFNLVLMDLQMPVCDGIDATRQIRALEQEHGWDKSVVCIVTGQDSPADRHDADEAGSNGYLVKPVGPKVLDRWVKQWFPDAGF